MGEEKKKEYGKICIGIIIFIGIAIILTSLLKMWIIIFIPIPIIIIINLIINRSKRPIEHKPTLKEKVSLNRITTYNLALQLEERKKIENLEKDNADLIIIDSPISISTIEKKKEKICEYCGAFLEQDSTKCRFCGCEKIEE